MMISVNGLPMQISSAACVRDLLRQLGYENDFVAVAINHHCIKRREFNERILNENDEVEVLAPMAGG